MAEFHEPFMPTPEERREQERERIGYERWAKQSWWGRRTSEPSDFTPPAPGPERSIFHEG